MRGFLSIKFYSPCKDDGTRTAVVFVRAFLTMMNVPEDIKRRIDERYARCPFSSIAVFLRENPDVDGFLQEMVDNEPWFKTKRKAFSCIAKNIFEPVKCANCGTVISIEKAIDGKKYCSNKCSCSSPERIEKVRQTSIAKFGCANAMQSKSIQDKLRKTNRERYGVDNVFQLEEKKEKIRQTNLERYGSELYVRSQDWKEKTVATNLEKFGVEFVAQNDVVKSKIRETNLKKYGGVAPACSDEVVQKMRRTNIDRYGSLICFMISSHLLSNYPKYSTDRGENQVTLRKSARFRKNLPRSSCFFASAVLYWYQHFKSRVGSRA